LIALDGSAVSLRAVRHVAEMLCAAREAHVTLLHVAAIKPELLEHPGGHDDAEEKALEKAVSTGVNVAKTALEAVAEGEIFSGARSLIHDLQSSEHPSSIDTKVIAAAHPDPAVAVIKEAATGEYDAVVLGRRGQGKIADLLLGSVATRVVKNVRNCAVWIVE
jgi:nucleotide-binding universal stress UspA family protein